MSWLILEMPFVVGAAYASAEGSLQGCIGLPQNDSAGETSDCIDPTLLESPYPDNPDVIISIEEQIQAYQSLLIAINDHDWIDGIVARGYYPPAALQDKSTSIHGKPSQELIAEWYNQFRKTANNLE